MNGYDEYSNYDLEALVKALIKIKAMNSSEKVMVSGKSGTEHYLDFLISSNSLAEADFYQPSAGDMGIIVREYNKSAGTDVINKADKIGRDLGLSRIMVVANQFSDLATQLADRIQVMVLPRGKLTTILRNHKVNLDS